MFYSIQYTIGWLAASYLFDMFTESPKPYMHSIIPFCKYSCWKNVIHQIDSKNEWLLLPASFTAKSGLVFVLTLGNDFFRGFILKPTEKT